MNIYYWIKRYIYYQLKLFIDILFPLNFAKTNKHYNLEILHYKESLPFKNYKTDFLIDSIAKSFDVYNATSQLEYLYKYTGRCFIEPKFGWLITSSNQKIILESLPYNVYPKPSRLDLVKYRKKLKIQSLISLRYSFDNYWHFHNDVLGQLVLLEQLKVDRSIPILIPNDALLSPFVNAFLVKNDTLKSRKWIVHNNDLIIEAQEVYMAKNLPNTRANFLGILKFLNYELPYSVGSNKTFIKRGSYRNRRLNEDNSKKVEDLVKLFGYSVVDADNIPIQDQINIFSNSSFVIGIHGAGLTNLLYRTGRNLNLLEIFPLNIYPPHYYWLCGEMGFKYNAISGTELNEMGEFTICLKKLHKYLLANS